MENKEKKSFFKSKMFLFAILPLFVIGLVVATGYIVSTLTLNIGVKEAFTVEYAILGDGQENWDGQTCEGATYFTPDVIDLANSDTMLPGQSRFVCVKITNEAGTLPYTITSTFTNDNADYDCYNAFGNPTDSGDALTGITYHGFEVKVAGNVKPVSGCLAKINVARG